MFSVILRLKDSSRNLGNIHDSKSGDNAAWSMILYVILSNLK